MKKLIPFCTYLIISIAFNNAHSHHSSTSTFNPERTSTIEGVITEFKFRNPHVLIYLDVTNPDGSVTNWMSEGSAATAWRRSGWDASVLKVGDKLRISGDATIDGSPMVWIDEMEYLDPDTNEVLALLTGNSNPALAFNTDSSESLEEDSQSTNDLSTIPLTLADGRPNFTGTTRANYNRTPGGPDANDAALPYNEAGSAALAAWDLTQDPQVFCEPPGLVRQGGYTPYGQIVEQFDDRIEIEYEEYGSKRTIYLDQPLSEKGELSPLGDSVARYEGDTLIIETVNLLANASGHRGRPLSDEIRVTEVFSRADDETNGSQLRIETTVHDPKFLTESWTISRTKRYDDAYEFIENECVPPIRAASTE